MDKNTEENAQTLPVSIYTDVRVYEYSWVMWKKKLKWSFVFNESLNMEQEKSSRLHFLFSATPPTTSLLVHGAYKQGSVVRIQMVTERSRLEETSGGIQSNLCSEQHQLWAQSSSDQPPGLMFSRWKGLQGGSQPWATRLHAANGF